MAMAMAMAVDSVPASPTLSGRRAGGSRGLAAVALVVAAAALSFASLLLCLSLETLSPPPNYDPLSDAFTNDDEGGNNTPRRRLLAMPMDGGGQRPRKQRNQQLAHAAAKTAEEYAQHGQAISGPGVIVNLLRRAKDVVSESDVPFLLEIPHTSSETIYNIMTQCYGLVGKRYDSTEELKVARRRNVVDNYYVSSHDRPASMFANLGERFHFLSTPYYQEGAGLLTLRHKGRIILMLRHPAVIAERMYLTRPGTKHGDIEGLVGFVNSTGYYDNWMTRMLANVPKHVEVTEEHFREARMILENKFLIGMTADLAETVKKRLGLYFGWKELPDKRGCEIEHIKKAALTLPPSALDEGGREWKFIIRRNRFDMKLYARGMAVFGDQKMRVPVHPVIRKEEKALVEKAFGHLRNTMEERDDSDIPFYWHIPKASGTTVKETLSDCYGLVRTEMIKPPSSLEVFEDKKVLNVDLSTPDSVAVAKKMRLADKGLADVFVSQLSLDGSRVFTSYHMGRAFTIMRHPVKLAASLFYYRRIATWEPTYRPEYKDITLKEYVETDGYYDNWMTRMLTNARLGGLNIEHLNLAKAILKDKFIIGISDHMDETFRHLELYYGWAERKQGCVNFHLHAAPSNKNKYPLPDRGGPVWEIIAEKNKFDMALYYYALELFGDQSEKLFREEKTIG